MATTKKCTQDDGLTLAVRGKWRSLKDLRQAKTKPLFSHHICLKFQNMSILIIVTINWPPPFVDLIAWLFYLPSLHCFRWGTLKNITTAQRFLIKKRHYSYFFQSHQIGHTLPHCNKNAIDIKQTITNALSRRWAWARRFYENHLLFQFPLRKLQGYFLSGVP